MSGSFPSRIALNGADYLMLAFDRYTRREYGNGNTCHLLLDLADNGFERKFRDRVATLPLLHWLNSLRLRIPWHGAAPFWEAARHAEAPIIETTTWEFEATRLFDYCIDPRNDAPIRFRLFGESESRKLLFSWHHALVDAHGAEMLLELVGARETRGDAIALFTPNPQGSTIGRKFKQARAARSAIFAAAASPRYQSVRIPSSSYENLRYRRIYFSPEETAQIDAVADTLHATFTKSCFYLCVVARAIFSVLESRGECAPLYIPVPHDMRRSKKGVMSLSNQVTFLYFRIEPAKLRTLSSGIEYLVQNMQVMIERELHRANLTFLELAKNIPLSTYEKLLRAPAGGTVASCFFSDTGDSLSKIQEFCGTRVQDAIHYPPQICPPGITAVFSRFNGALSIMLPYADDCFNVREIRLIEESIREDLRGATAMPESRESAGG